LTHLTACCFLYNATASAETYTLSLHDALPISQAFGRDLRVERDRQAVALARGPAPFALGDDLRVRLLFVGHLQAIRSRELRFVRSEEHTSELQSRGHLVCRLLLEKK